MGADKKMLETWIKEYPYSLKIFKNISRQSIDKKKDTRTKMKVQKIGAMDSFDQRATWIEY